MSSPTIHSPKDLLYPLQRAFVDDTAQYKLGVTTRQWGKSTTTSGEAIHDSITDPGTTWVCMSAGERQSVEWLNKAKEWLAAYRMAIEDIAEDRGGLAEGLLRSAEIRLANNSRVIAIPANPSTARGYSANIILDEFAYHEDPRAIWAAMFPSTTNALAGTFLDRWRALLSGASPHTVRRQLKVRIVSTFNGKNNKFYELYESALARKNDYSVHRVTIHDAIRDGMPLDAAKLKAALDDPEIWAQEYECTPLDACSVLLPYDLLATCESPETTTTLPPEYWATTPAVPHYIGIDYARSRDLSVAWVMARHGDVLHTREIVIMRGLPTPDQIDILRPRIQRATRVALDYTGPGIGMGDYLVKEFGQYHPATHRHGKIELITFTNTLKVDLFAKLRMAFEQRTLRVPIDRDVREDLHSIQRITTPSGNITYRAPRNADGHADRASALALVHRAAQHTAAPPTLPVIYTTPTTRAVHTRRHRAVLG